MTAPDGMSLHVEEFGPPDEPAILLVHGWTCESRFWTMQIQALANERRVVAYDLRGHGRSGRAAGGDYSIDAHAGDLGAVLGAITGDGERPVVAGHSLGAMALVAWAGTRAPAEVAERIAAAALINTGMGDLVSESLVVRTPAPLARAQRAIGTAMLGAAAPLPRATTPISHRIVRHVALSPSASPAQVAFCEEMVLQCSSDVRAACGGTLSKLDLREAIAHLEVPAVVVAGEADRLTPPAHAHRLAEALSRVEREVHLPGAGHMCPVTDHDVISDELRRLVRDHGRVAAVVSA